MNLQKLERIQKVLKETLLWCKSHKVLTIVVAGGAIFLIMFFNGRARTHRMIEERQLLQECIERENQARNQARQAQLLRENQARELYRLLSSAYKNEDNLENRKALKRIRELISILGVDIKNDQSESLLYYAYKNNLPEKFTSLLKECGTKMSEEEAFEVERKKEEKKRKAVESFLEAPTNANYAMACVDVGANLSDFDNDEKSLLFKSLREVKHEEFPFEWTKCSRILKRAGLNFRPEEEKLISENMSKLFWGQIHYCVSSGWQIDAAIVNTTSLIADFTEFEELGINVSKVLNSPKPESIQIKGADYKNGTALFFVKLEMIEALKREIREIEDEEFRMKSKKLEKLAVFLEKSGATTRSEEKEWLANKTKELESVAAETEMKIFEMVFKVASREKRMSTEEFKGLLGRLKDLRKYDQGVGPSLLYNAFYWEIVLPEEIEVPGGGGWRYCAEHDNYLSRVTSSSYPLDKDKIDLLKEHGAVFKKGEEEELKCRAQKWLVNYLLSDISCANRVENTGKFVWEIAWEKSEIEFVSVTDSFWLDDSTGLNPYFRKLFSSNIVERVFPPLLELCGGSLPSEVKYSSFAQGRVCLTQKHFHVFGGELAKIFSENEKRDKHSLLYIAWDKCYPKEALELLEASGVKYINEEEAIVSGLKKAQGTVLLSKFITDGATTATVGALRSILGCEPDVNATFDGHSILWHAKKNGLDKVLINLLEDAGAKLASGE